MKLVFLCFVYLLASALTQAKQAPVTSQEVLQHESLSLAKKNLLRKQLEQKNRTLVNRQLELIRLRRKMALNKQKKKSSETNTESSNI